MAVLLGSFFFGDIPKQVVPLPKEKNFLTKNYNKVHFVDIFMHFIDF